MTPSSHCWTKITPKDKELADTIEKLFDDPIKQRALYFNLKFKQVTADLVIIEKQRNILIKKNQELNLIVIRQKKIIITIAIGGFIFGVSIGIGLIALGTKISQLLK
jgi:hypothetical protein